MRPTHASSAASTAARSSPAACHTSSPDSRTASTASLCASWISPATSTPPRRGGSGRTTRRRPRAATRRSSATIAFSSPDSAATFRCRLDGGELEPCASPRELAGLAEGEHTFEVEAGDRAGNVDSSPAVHRWKVDTTPPQTVITSGPAALTKSTSASFEFSSKEPGTTFKCRRDTGAYSSCTSPKRYGSLTEGPHSFEVRATDAAGNVETTPPTGK